LLAILALALWLQPLGLWAAPTITYVQGNYATPQTPPTTVKVTFTGAQASGDLNVVVVGWNDSAAAVSSVADSSGNAYTLLWAVQNLGDPNNDGATPGVLIAYDATDVSRELYDSNEAGSRDAMDYPASFRSRSWRTARYL
jgi:hypothetical protein